MTETTIDAIDGSRKRFTKRHQCKSDRVRRFQNASAFPDNSILMHSCSKNGVKNNSITKRDVDVSIGMLGPSECTQKGKSSRLHPNAITFARL